MVATFGKRVLLVLPHKGFDEEEFRSTRSSLRKSGVDCKVASTSTEKAEGGVDYYFPEYTLDQVQVDEYDGIVFMGGEGADSLWDNSTAQNLAKQFASKGKIVASIGRGVGVLAKSGVLGSTRVTGDPGCKDVVERSGAKFTSSQVEPRWLRGNPKKIVTAFDSGATQRFGQRIVRDL